MIELILGKCGVRVVWKTYGPTAGFDNTVRKFQRFLDHYTVTVHSISNEELGTILANYPLTPKFAVVTA
jgi:hypothetical protein